MEGRRSHGNDGGLRAAYRRYSGPVKNSYQSPQSVMTMKRSAFLPLPTSSSLSHCDLLSYHMRTHYRRIAQAESRTDTSQPVSLLKCTKVLDQSKKRKKAGVSSSMSSSRSRLWNQSTHRTYDRQSYISRPTEPSDTPIATPWHRLAPESDAGFVSMSQSMESLRLTEHKPPSSEPHEYDAKSTTDGCGGYNTTYLYDSPDADYTGDRSSINTPRLSPRRTLASPRQGYRHLLGSTIDPDSRWLMYHTKTGKLTGYLRYKNRLSTSMDRGKSSTSKNVSPHPWKPAFNLNSPYSQSHGSTSPERLTSSRDSRTPSCHRKGRGQAEDCSATIPAQAALGVCKQDQGQPEHIKSLHTSSSSEDTEVRIDTAEGGTVLHETHTVHTLGQALTVDSSGQPQDCDTSTQDSDTSTQDGVSTPDRGEEGRLAVGEHSPQSSIGDGKPIITVTAEPAIGSGVSLVQDGHKDISKYVLDSEAVEGSSVEQRGRKVIAACDQLTQQSLAVQKRSQEARERVEEKSRECDYLEFISGVTRDILGRGILTDPAMAILFRAHVDKYRHRLREDVMWQKIEEFRKELSITR